MKNNKNASVALATMAALALCCVPAAAAPKRAAKAAAGQPPTAAQAAFHAADAAYKAYDRRDYAAAVTNAEEAVRLEPARREYRVLLVNALTAAQRHGEAESALEQGIQAAGADAAFTQAREALRRAQAQAAGAEMYKALAAGDVQRAIVQARAAVTYAPEHPGYRLALVHALLRGNQFAQAEGVAGEAVALLPDSGVPLALRAYARDRLGRPAESRADIDRALAQRGLAPAQVRELRLIAADQALATGDAQRALELLRDLPDTDAGAAQRRTVARQLLAAPATAKVVFAAPGIDCSHVDSAQTCTVTAGAAPQEPGYLAAAAAYKAMDAKDFVAALPLARQAATASPANRDYQLLLMNAALGAQQFPEAEAAASRALALAPGDGQVLAQRAAIRRSLGNTAGANEDARAALGAGTLPPLDRAYLAVQAGDDRSASDAFAQADALRQLPATALQDAGYAAMHARRDAMALDYFRRSVDAAESLQLKMDRQGLFETRRTVSELDRKWGVLASLTWRQGGGTEPGFGVTSPGAARTLQAGAEAYYRPWGFMNGQFVDLFVRGFQTLHSEAGGVSGGDSFAGALGVRWKPLTQQNMVLSASRLFGPGSGSDWLLQAAYSHDRGSDLRVDVPSWWTTRIAAEVGRYFSPSQTYGLASLMVGRSWRLGGDNGRNVLFPHGVLAGEYNSALAERTSFGIGPGVSLRHWFREDRYHAPQSYLDFTLQYRFPIGGDERIKGTYLNALVSY